MSRLARLGAFIVATLAVLAAGVFIIGSKEYLFRSTYQLKTQFDNVAGLAHRSRRAGWRRSQRNCA